MIALHGLPCHIFSLFCFNNLSNIQTIFSLLYKNYRCGGHNFWPLIWIIVLQLFMAPLHRPSGAFQVVRFMWFLKGGYSLWKLLKFKGSCWSEVWPTMNLRSIPLVPSCYCHCWLNNSPVNCNNLWQMANSGMPQPLTCVNVFTGPGKLCLD